MDYRCRTHSIQPLDGQNWMCAELSYSETLLFCSWFVPWLLIPDYSCFSCSCKSPSRLGCWVRLRHLHAWNEMRLCLRGNLLLQDPQAPLQNSLGFHFSLWDTVPESHSMVENLISRLSLLIANLYHFVLVPALIFITEDFSSPLVFTWQWSVYRETSHSFPGFVL